MTALLMPNDILSLSAQAARRLMDSGSGDGALLYLALLEGGGDEEKARRALKWNEERLSAAHALLVRLELVQPRAEAPAPAPPVDSDVPPDYTRADLLTALEEEPSFSDLSRAVEQYLGKPMSETDLKSLYTIYDFLALPGEVILLLAHWCARETERKYGKGKRPRMAAIKKEAFRWKRLGADTLEAAEAYLRRQQALIGREQELLPLLGIRDRLPVDKEREFIAAWVEMGFADDAIRLAYERTLFQKQQMNWNYMNSILKRWHQAGFRTAAEVEAGDKPPKRTAARAAAPAPAAEDRQQAAGKLKGELDWMDEFLKTQKG